MKYRAFIILLCCFLFEESFSKQRMEKVTINLIETSDVHGNLFPYNFINRSSGKGSLARVSSFVKENREKYKDNCILLDNGDMLQGQPTVYYYNFLDTISPHIGAQIMNYLKYDVGNMGNHDVETGHKVYDRWISECNFPILGANIINKKTGEPYLKPYQTFTRSGVRIVVLGLITPAIPCWLPENLWEGLFFDNMLDSAKKWMKIIKEKEKPDVIVGLFHSGSSGSVLNGYVENASMDVAKNVPGFDVVFIGHDHQLSCEKIVNVNGQEVLVVDPGSKANNVASVNIELLIKDKKVVKKSVDGSLINMNDYPIDRIYIDKFSEPYEIIDKFVSERIGTISSSISAKEAFFGPCGFIDLIHDLQLKISGAEVSFSAPLSYDSKIEKGDIYMSDMFKLYSYENMLYVMNLSGKEIKDYLEYSYSKWINTVENEDDHFLLLKHDEGNKYTFQNASFNFDSAAGIIYTVDITKPIGDRVSISSLCNGDKFDMDRIYKVAVNSYRGNGGGDLLTSGAGIPKDELTKRIVSSTDKDMRYYLMQYIIQEKNINVPQLRNWKFIPDSLYLKTSKKDRKLLFRE